MKRIIKHISMLLVFIFSITFLSACGNQNSNNLSSRNSAETYKNNGYYEVIDNNYVSFEAAKSNTVVIAGKKLVKKNSNITFKLNEKINTHHNSLENFDEYFNFESGKTFVGFEIGGQIYKIDDINNRTIKITSNLTATPAYLDFDIIGAFVYANSPFCTYSKTSINCKLLNHIFNSETSSNYLFTAYFNTTNFDNICQSDFVSNTSSNFKITKQNEFFNAEFAFEVPLETTEIYCGLIAKDLENNFTLINLKSPLAFADEILNINFPNLSQQVGALNNVTINVSTNLTYSDEYTNKK